MTTSFETQMNDSDDLDTTVMNAFNNSSGGHGGLAAFSFMLFVLIYTPCAATVAQSARIFGKSFATKSVIISIVAAYIISTLFFQISIRL